MNGDDVAGLTGWLETRMKYKFLKIVLKNSVKKYHFNIFSDSVMIFS